ncbi:hypothetical protein ACMXYQ_07625 [Neptuniibacter sp. PT34_22]|uniref:hypothetical protein n=1 Tax=Neptuniibacter sp. PT34_22 TaxID=3398205 RepID=UPI0039F53322
MYLDQDSTKPTSGAGSTAPTQTTLPDPVVTDTKVSTKAKCNGMCHEQLVDLVHVTGANTEFLVLDQILSDELDEETKLVEKWLAENRAVYAAGINEENPEKIDKSKQDRMCKLEEGVKLGLIVPGEPKAETKKTQTVMSQEDIEGLITSLENEKLAVTYHSPNFLLDYNFFTKNYTDLKAARLLMIEAEIKRLKGNQTKMPKASKTLASFNEKKYTFGTVKEKSASSGNGEVTTTESIREGGLNETKEVSKSTKKNKQGFDVVEISRASTPDKFYYVRKEFSEKTLYKSARVKKVNITEETIELVRQKKTAKDFGKALAEEVISDVKDKYSKFKEAPLKNTAFKLFETKSSEDNVLNAWHAELLNFDTTDGNPDKIMAYTADAHALRFASSAVAEVSGFDKATMGGAFSMKGNAALSILEGSVGAAVTLPRVAGFDCFISYKNEKGEQIYHRFGAFRLKGEIVLSCFAGAKLNGDASVSMQLLPGERKEISSGATALVDPTVKVGTTPGGNVTVKGGAFAGAEAGGTVSGAIEWLHPDKQIVSVFDGWSALADVKAGASFQVGAGLAASFEVGLRQGKFVFHVHGSLVFGPGAGGEFGVGVDFQQIYKLLMLIVDILQDIDYRHLEAITVDAFNFFYQGIYKYYVEPELLFDNLFESVDDISYWWRFRKADKDEAYALAKSINSGSVKWSVDRLVPEILGPMLYTLTKTWIFMGEQQQTAQEQAIVKLLSPIKSWRLFTESLHRMSEDGGKQGDDTAEGKAELLFTGLERLNSILNDEQQLSFNRWVSQLEHRQPGQKKAGMQVASLPFTPDPNPSRKLNQVNQQVMLAWQNDLPSDSRYV